MILRSIVLVAFLSICTNAHHAVKNPLGTLYRWKQIDFAFPTAQDRELSVQNGMIESASRSPNCPPASVVFMANPYDVIHSVICDILWKSLREIMGRDDDELYKYPCSVCYREFNQINVIPLGVERWKHRLFVSTPRWKRGVPATLSALPVTAQEESPLLRPFPGWEWHTAGNCTGFTSIFRMSIDHCGTMWALDSGQVEAFETPRNLCPPTLFAINLETDTVIGRFPIPSEFVLQNSLITNLVVDSRDAECKDLHVYMADAWRFGLIVFRAADSSFWRYSHYTFYPEPLLSNYTLHGLNYQWSDGIFGMSLGQLHRGDRPLYYHSMSSSLEFVVKTSVLRDPSRVNNAVDEFKLLGESRGLTGQVSAAAIDRNGVMFFNLISKDSIGCWNTRKAYKLKNLYIVAKNNNTLIFPNDLRIDHEVPQIVWIITNRLPMYQFNLIDPNEYNYRLMHLDPNGAVQNTVCQN